MMFRGNAAHNSTVSPSDDLVYDTKAWQFFAGAPIRSTPLVGKDMIWFGNTRGDFLRLTKTKAM
jgi:hypothetical protein